ncbi:FUSC family protein [Blastococcus sp. TF02A-30]|uniref:FUSC family protein n=1 Tax=Blastococcus sp. TF02A-30 TaxID=2250580 RepID=UPI0013142E73|nr:FUSC family protein [Blastococcus sp. TF02A-30]
MRTPPLLRDTVRAGRPCTVAQRVAGALPTVLQCGLASAVAWWVAEALLGHAQPVFAATSAVVCLAAGTGGRARQAVDLLAGVLVGVLVGQVVRVVQAEPGTLTTLVAVTAALLAASLLDTRTLALIQAGASALFVLTLPPVETPFVRFLDAAVGGALGLLASQVLFTPDPVRLVRGPARAVLADVAAALRAADPDHAREHARQAVAGLGDLATARSTAWAVAARTVRGRLRADRLACLDRDLTDIDVLGAAALLHAPGRRGLPPGLADDVAAAADALGEPGGRAGELLRRVVAGLTGPDGSARRIPG